VRSGPLEEQRHHQVPFSVARAVSRERSISPSALAGSVALSTSARTRRTLPHAAARLGVEEAAPYLERLFEIRQGLPATAQVRRARARPSRPHTAATGGRLRGP